MIEVSTSDTVSITYSVCCVDMVHRDLKLENILMTTTDFGPDFNIKVTDFGLSNMKGIAGCDEQMMDCRCGTLFYMGNGTVCMLKDIYLNCSQLLRF